MTAGNPEATYACVNYGEASTVEDIAGRSICINGDIGDVLNSLLKDEDKGSSMKDGF